MLKRTDICCILIIGAGPIVTDQPAFSVQYHPEASPGPQDSHYLFEKFAGVMG